MQIGATRLQIGATRQLTSGELQAGANLATESVPGIGTTRQSKPDVQTGATRQMNPPDEPNWGYPADESAKRSQGRIGATRQLTSRPNWCHPSVAIESLNRRHPSFQSVESEPTVASADWCHPSVEVASPNWCHPSVEYGRTRRIGTTRQFTLGEGGRTGANRQLNSGGEGEWCHAHVRRRRGVPALGLVFLRQTAAVGAGLASLLASSAAEYPAWLILLKLA